MPTPDPSDNVQYADFFGGDAGGSSVLNPTTSNVLRPARTTADMEREERERIAANYARGLDASGNPLPAYGTPASQGGTAQGYQVQQHSTGTVNASTGARNAPLDRAPVQGDFDHNGAFVPGLVGAGNGTQSKEVADSLASARGLADTVLGSDVTVKSGNQVNTTNRDALTPVVDPNLDRNAEVDRAFAMSEDLVNRITNAPSQTALIADRSLSNQLAIGRSSPGGIGAVQQGIKGAMGQAPQLQAQAAQQSIQEQQARAAAATDAANIYAGVASGTADRAVRIAESNQKAGLSVLNNLTTLTGFDYEFDTAKMNAIGQLTRDFFNNAQQFANMDVELQKAQWEDLTRRYEIDANFKAAMEKIAAEENIGPLDAFKLVLGGATAGGALAAGLG